MRPYPQKIRGISLLLALLLASCSSGDPQRTSTTTDATTGDTVYDTVTMPVRDVLADSGSTICAVLDGGVWCWGDGRYGQRGETGFTLSAYGDGNSSTTQSGAEVLLREFVYRVQDEIEQNCTEADLRPPHEYCLKVSPKNVTDAQAFSIAAAALSGEIGKGSWGLYTFDYKPETSTLTVTDPRSGRNCLARIKVADTPLNDQLDSWEQVQVNLEILESQDCRNFFDRLDEPKQPHPTLVRGMESDVSTITAGKNHFCGVRTGGVWCWGSDAATNRDALGGGGPWMFTMGKLGNLGALSPGIFFLADDRGISNYLVPKSLFSATPVPVIGLENNVSQVAAGVDHTCALRQGEVLCWGANNLGQIGTNPRNPTSWYIGGDFVPEALKVEGLGAGVQAISAFGDTSCALTAEGSVMCWGNNRHLQIGSFANTIRFNESDEPEYGGDTYSHYTPSPVVVEGFTSGVSMLGEGCALRDGRVVCWGRNDLADLNFDDEAEYLKLRPREATVTGMAGEIQALLGPHYINPSSLMSLTCGLAKGAVHCWESRLKQIPNDTVGPYTLPSFVPSEMQRDVVAMDDTCAMVAHNNQMRIIEIWCWGEFKLSDGKFEPGIGMQDDLYADSYDVPVTLPALVFCYNGGAFYRPVGLYGSQKCDSPPVE